ncbi:skeletor [Trichonephila inaurata madagascariensis]|uniref:Skeletor n=1 Tax=Trichonephila inaurata madagascariensis TaxID=2747483 RepID=A0A8X6XMD5_9ARAC|nr:skeletor [Trichonephila inaurata madagascariensis]
MMGLQGGSSRRMLRQVLLAVFGVIITTGTAVGQTKYYGRLIGTFHTYAHGVRGTVYVANENTIFIKDFEYDGQGPDAFFWGDILRSLHQTDSSFHLKMEPRMKS